MRKFSFKNALIVSVIIHILFFIYMSISNHDKNKDNLIKSTDREEAQHISAATVNKDVVEKAELEYASKKELNAQKALLESDRLQKELDLKRNKIKSMTKEIDAKALAIKNEEARLAELKKKS